MQILQDTQDSHNTLQIPSAGPAVLLFFMSTSRPRIFCTSSQTTMADVNRAAELLIPTILTTIVAFIATAFRIYVRLRVTKLLDWDDFFNVLANVSSMMLLRLLHKTNKQTNRSERGGKLISILITGHYVRGHGLGHWRYIEWNRTTYPVSRE
jgi:hypothetical protein